MSNTYQEEFQIRVKSQASTPEIYDTPEFRRRIREAISSGKETPLYWEIKKRVTEYVINNPDVIGDMYPREFWGTLAKKHIDYDDKKRCNVDRAREKGCNDHVILYQLSKDRKYYPKTAKAAGITVQEIIAYLEYPEGHPSRENVRYVRGYDLKELGKFVYEYPPELIGLNLADYPEVYDD
jgi:hypothetical protein